MRGRGIGTARGRATIMRGALSFRDLSSLNLIPSSSERSAVFDQEYRALSHQLFQQLDVEEVHLNLAVYAAKLSCVQRGRPSCLPRQ